MAIRIRYCADNGRVACEPVLLLGVSILQYLEGVPDRQAVEMVRYQASVSSHYLNCISLHASSMWQVLTIDTFPLNETGGAPPGALWLPNKPIGPLLTTLT